jgi:hypothetical protein
MRGFIAGVLVLVGLILVPFATVGIWTERKLLDTEAFTDLAAEVLHQEPVRDALAKRLVDELVNRQPRLALGRIVLEPAMRQVLGTSQFEQIFRLAVSDMHAQLERGDDQLQLNLDAMLPILRGLVAEVSSGLANQIPDSAGLPSITVVRKEQVPQVWFGVQVTREASWVFPLLMLLAFATAIAIARQHARTLVVVGFGLAVVCLLLALALGTGRDMVSDVAGPEVDVAAFDAAYDVVTDSLVTQTLLLGGLGLVGGGVGVALLLRRSGSTRPTAWA